MQRKGGGGAGCRTRRRTLFSSNLIVLSVGCCVSAHVFYTHSYTHTHAHACAYRRTHATCMPVKVFLLKDSLSNKDTVFGQANMAPRQTTLDMVTHTHTQTHTHKHIHTHKHTHTCTLACLPANTDTQVPNNRK